MNSEPKANVLLDEHSGDPMVVLWRALNGRRPELAMAVINDPRCGIERKSIGGFELKSSMGKFNHAQGGCTPLLFAAFGGRTDVMIDLLAAGADVTASDLDRNFTPLHLAQSVEAVRLLIAHGCDVNARSRKGITPLRTFIGSSKSDIVALLVAEGADVKSVSLYFIWPCSSGPR